MSGSPPNWRLVGAIVFGFGLVHGLGLSTRLQGIVAEEDSRCGSSPSTSGSSSGKLAVLAVVVVPGRGSPASCAGRRRRACRVRRDGRRAWQAAGDPAFTAETEPAVAAGTSCTEASYAPPAAGGGGHPPRRFYGPGEEAPSEEHGARARRRLGRDHLRADLPAASRRALERWVWARIKPWSPPPPAARRPPCGP